MKSETSALKGVRYSFGLLSGRDRRRFLFVLILQIGLAFLDLAGILIIGLVAALTAGEATGQPTPLGDLIPLVGSMTSDVNRIVILAAVGGFALVLKSILGLLVTRRVFRFLAIRQALIASGIANQLMSRPLLEVQRRTSQETSIALTTGATALTLGTLGPASVMVAELALLTVLFAGLLVVDPFVAIFSLVFFGILVALLQFLLGSWAARLGKDLTDTQVGSIEVLQQAMTAYREISVTRRRFFFVERFQQLRWKAARVLADQYILSQIGKYVFEIGLIVGGGLLVVFVIATRDVTAAVGIIAVFFATATRLIPSLLRLQTSLIDIRNASGSAAVTIRLLAELQESDDVSDSSGNYSAASYTYGESALLANYEAFEPHVEVSRVSLTYPSADCPALDGIELEIPANSSVAFVGATGAGKSTLADVILGVSSPDVGLVSISGLAPQECIDRWPGALGYVPQSVALLSGTVRDNVAIGLPRPLIDDSLVEKALDRAHLSSFLSDAREGLDTLVGESGVRLSGGQRQRLGIARALYTQPHLLIMDEATSALDAETEWAITQTLQELSGSLTLILIAHRLATVRHCDQVVYLSEGRILARGTFDEVRASVPDFDRQAELLGL